MTLATPAAYSPADALVRLSIGKKFICAHPAVGIVDSPHAGCLLWFGPYCKPDRQPQNTCRVPEQSWMIWRSLGERMRCVMPRSAPCLSGHGPGLFGGGC